MADPFTLVYDKCWDMLLGNQDLGKRVKLGNRHAFETSNAKDPATGSVLIAKRPSIAVISDGATPSLENTSSSSFLTMNLYTLILTGSANPREELFPLQWETIRAMLTWWTTLRALTYNDEVFVHDASMGSVVQSLVDDTQNQVNGWVGRLNFTVACHFQTSAIKP